MNKDRKNLIINTQRHRLDGFRSYMEDNVPTIKNIMFTLSCPLLKGSNYNKKRIIITYVLNFFQLGFHFVINRRKKYDSILLIGMVVTIPFLLLIKIFPFVKPARSIIVIHFFMHGLGSKKIIQQILGLLFNDEKIILVTQSHYDKKYYSQIVNKLTTVHFPYCQKEISVSGNSGEGEKYIFSGGYSNRDYDCLLKAAENINYNFILICSKLNQFTTEIPANVKVLKDVKADEFISYLKNSRIVVIPLKMQIGSAGQGVALTAQFLKKPVIYTKGSALSEYFDNSISGISYESTSVEDLKEKIIYLLSHSDVSKELGENAFKKYCESFRMDNYYRFLSGLLSQKNLDEIEIEKIERNRKGQSPKRDRTRDTMMH